MRTLELVLTGQPPHEDSGPVNVRPHGAIGETCASCFGFKLLEFIEQIANRPLVGHATTMVDDGVFVDRLSNFMTPPPRWLHNDRRKQRM